jgi:transposase
MSTWRRKAIESFPDFRREFEQSDTTIYQVFFALLPRVREAYARADMHELQRIYDFAQWCFRRRRKTFGTPQGLHSTSI